ncbi:hypothetical protein TSAR_015071 [Trichomalopsis sarcophagae]|uniref:ER lumen protein-retaining receptor n=1 Tax=Trichomalopsis sarcophagae TaxID=543379 RepID=A0A232EWT6_9HYME|nr:hypothetical protein TSAR_015071 [Trichomalopsis sarcophagae]
MMALFGLFGLCALLGAKFMLLAKILWTKDCTGISGKTQVLYGIVFATRYLDIVTTYYTYPINVSLTRISFTALTYCIVLSIFFFYSDSYQIKYDKFRIELLILPCIVLSLLSNYGFDVVAVFWAFSVYLESVAILPQVYMVARAKRVENIVYYYVSVLSVHKVFLIAEAIYRFYLNEPYDRISLAAGLVQLMFYCDFFLREVPIGDDLDKLETAQPQQQVLLTEADEARAAKEAEAARSVAANDELREVVLTPTALERDNERVAVVTPGEHQEARATNEASVRT